MGLHLGHGGVGLRGKRQEQQLVILYCIQFGKLETEKETFATYLVGVVHGQAGAGGRQSVKLKVIKFKYYYCGFSGDMNFVSHLPE